MTTDTQTYSAIIISDCYWNCYLFMPGCAVDVKGPALFLLVRQLARLSTSIAGESLGSIILLKSIIDILLGSIWIAAIITIASIIKVLQLFD